MHPKSQNSLQYAPVPQRPSTGQSGRKSMETEKLKCFCVHPERIIITTSDQMSWMLYSSSASFVCFICSSELLQDSERDLTETQRHDIVICFIFLRHLIRPYLCFHSSQIILMNEASAMRQSVLYNQNKTIFFSNIDICFLSVSLEYLDFLFSFWKSRMYLLSSC